MTWLLDDKIQDGIGLSLAEMTVEPGAVSELHKHGNCKEIVYIVEGLVLQRLGDEWTELRSGDTCVVEIGVAHQTRNVGAEPAKMLLFYSEGEREYESLQE